jgi:putative aldouronate transport system substrate-binding protein
MQNKWWGLFGPHITPQKWANGVVPNGNDVTIPLGRSIGPAVQYANKNPIVGLIYNEQEQEIINEYQATILSYVHESYARFVMGDLNLDTQWDSYVAEFDRMGYKEVIAASQSAYDRMNK